MPIIFELGDEFWIEHVTLATITMADAAGRITSTNTVLERPGTYLGAAFVSIGGGDVGNTQAIGWYDLRDQGGTALTFGENLTGLVWRITKQAATGAGTVTASVLVFMRKARG